MKRIAEPARLQVAEQVQHVDPRRGVEHADDLVRDEESDVEQERARDEHALQLAAAELVGVLAEHVAGVEADGLERRFQLRVATRRRELLGEVLAAEHREDAVRLEDRVVRAERILEDPLHVAVVLLELSAAPGARCPRRRSVIAPRVTRRRRRIIFPIVDLPLPLSPMSDDDLAGLPPRS